MFSEPAIRVENLSKCYQLYDRPHDRLKQFLWRGRRKYYREFWALNGVSFDVMPGEVIGIIGNNGAGKSTLLQMVCGTLTPTSGNVTVNGRVAALLELGAGFNPEFTGRENIYMGATIAGLSEKEIDERYESIVEFSGIRAFIDQPVKTYSSGMFIRLAFSVATSVDPDILVIDEALSVGDGAFSRKSFNRIMQMRDAGKTILFCSHSLFQVESICGRCVWLQNGKVVQQGEAAAVTAAYQAFLDRQAAESSQPLAVASTASSFNDNQTAITGHAKIRHISVTVDDASLTEKAAIHGESRIVLTLGFQSDQALPIPTVGVTIEAPDGRIVTSVATWEDNFLIDRDQNGAGSVKVEFGNIALLKGEYSISAYLLCEKGIHLYDQALGFARFHVVQKKRLLGFFELPHRWT